MTWWTTKELETAKRLYRVGGYRRVQSVFPNRTMLAIQAQAREGKWEFWTSIAPGSIAEQMLEWSKDAPMTAMDFATEFSMKTNNVSAILSQLYRRGVMVRFEIQTYTETMGPRKKFAYSPNPEFIEAMKHEATLPQPTAVR